MHWNFVEKQSGEWIIIYYNINRKMTKQKEQEKQAEKQERR